MKTYIYPENLKANVKLWFWNVRDFIIICGGIILSVVVLVNLAANFLLDERSIKFYDKKEK